MTGQQLQAIEAACTTAHPGPWTCTDYRSRWGFWSIDAGRDLWLASVHHDHQATAAFLVGSRTWVPQLLAEVRRLSAELAAVRQQQHQQLHDEQEERT